MSVGNEMRQTARVAGLLYLIVVLTGIFSLAYVPSQLNVAGDSAATVSNIMASKPLFRLGIVAGLACYTAFLMLPLALYKLLSPFGKGAATLMVAFAAASVPISFVNQIHKLDMLTLLSGAEYLQALSAEQLRAQVMIALDAYRNGMLVSQIFWGLWLLPFGWLVYKSGFLPKVLGVLLMMGCFGYLIDFAGTTLYPGYADTLIAKYASLPGTLGEIGICLWLLIVGVREPKLPFVPVGPERTL
jgi:hypothetical protein